MLCYSRPVLCEEERRYEVVVTAYHKEKLAGRKPCMTQTELSKEFGVPANRMNVIRVRVAHYMLTRQKRFTGRDIFDLADSLSSTHKSLN